MLLPQIFFVYLIKSDNLSRIEANRKAVEELYTWKGINTAYEDLFAKALKDNE